MKYTTGCGFEMPGPLPVNTQSKPVFCAGFRLTRAGIKKAAGPAAPGSAALSALYGYESFSGESSLGLRVIIVIILLVFIHSLICNTES